MRIEGVPSLKQIRWGAEDPVRWIRGFDGGGREDPKIWG